MADLYRSTNRLQENPYPERSHLLSEGIIDIVPGDYYVFQGGYISIASFNISDFVKLGNRQKGFTPETLEIKIWKTTKITPGGQINDYFNPLPFTKFENLSTGQVKEYALVQVTNQYIIGDDLSISLLDITHYMSTLPGRTQSFSYKIYNTIYPFTDT